MRQRTRHSSARRSPFTRQFFNTKRSWLPRSAAPVSRFLRSHKRVALASGLFMLVAVLAATLFSQGALSPVHASNVLNNEGLTLDSATSKGGFDTSGNSYSETLLNTDGFPSGGTATVSGLSFSWPTVASGSPTTGPDSARSFPVPRLPAGPRWASWARPVAGSPRARQR